MTQKTGQLYRAIGAVGEMADNARPAVASRRQILPQLPEIVDRPTTAKFIWITFLALSASSAIEDWLRGEIGVITGSIGIAVVILGRVMLKKTDLAYLVATPPAAFLVAVTLPSITSIVQSANPLNQFGATAITRLSNLAPFILSAFVISFLLFKIANRK